MPISQKVYATVVDNLANRVTPRKKKEIQNRGLGKRNLFSEENEAPSGMDKHEKQKNKNRYERPKSSASVMTRYLLAKALRANRIKYKEVKQLGLTNHMYAKAGRKLSPQLKRKRSGLPQETKEKIRNFWYQISRPLPIKKRVKKKVPLYLLECTYITAFKQFRRMNTDKVGYVAFVKLKPKNVRQLKPSERIVCCCVKCENVKLSLNALNTACTRIERSDLRLGSERECSDLTVCNYETFPAEQCLQRTCNDCGTRNISTHYKCLVNKIGDEEIKTSKWKYVKETKLVKNNEKVITSVQLVTETKKVKYVVQELQEQVKDLSSHLFRAKWQ